MSASFDTYVRQQGLNHTYEVEYTSMRYRISLNGKVLKDVVLPLDAIGPNGKEDCWAAAVADIEFLRGMDEE